VRLLHTSDWHLGRSLHGEALIDAQAAFADLLVEVVASEGIDAVLVAGDLYDRAIPPLDAVELFDDTLLRLRSTGVPVVLIAGNHDSAGRLAFGSRLLEAAGVHLRTRVETCGEPVLLADGAGDVAIYPLPYLEPALSCSPLEAGEVRHEAVLRAAMGRVAADRARRGEPRAVVVAHAFVTGGETCDSERDLTVGGTASVPAAVFAGVDYVALGHLHRPQQLAERIAYSGSPIAYSFSEAGHPKSFTVVDLPASGPPRLERIPIPPWRPMARLRGSFDELLSSAEFTGHEQSWLEITVTDEGRPANPMERLRKRFPHVLRLVFEASTTTEVVYGEKVEGRSDLDVCRAFVEHVRGRPVTAAEDALLDAAVQAQRIAEVA
jgi:exonuclease SbcD